MLPIRATKRERGDGDLSDGPGVRRVSERNDVDPFWSGSDVHHWARSFGRIQSDYTFSDMLFSEGRPPRKAF